MATFISTIRFTKQGMKDIRETTQRAKALRNSAEKMGIELTGVYWTMGDHDGVLIFEAPNDETATALLLKLGSAGNVQTTTVRAFTVDDMDSILAKT